MMFDTTKLDGQFIFLKLNCFDNTTVLFTDQDFDIPALEATRRYEEGVVQ